MTEEERFQAFLVGLEELTKKYGVAVAGCGCCGSPRLEQVSPEGEYTHYTQFDRVEWLATKDAPVRAEVSNNLFTFSVVKEEEGAYVCSLTQHTPWGKEKIVNQKRYTPAGVVDFFGNGHLARELYDELGIDYAG